MKIGLDIHGVIDRNPDLLAATARSLVTRGDDVWLITGAPWGDRILKTLDLCGFRPGHNYTAFFSIVDYHKSIGTEMWEDKNGYLWTDDEPWDRTKGDFAKKVGLDTHWDDTVRYGDWFPEGVFRLYSPEDFKKEYGL